MDHVKPQLARRKRIHEASRKARFSDVAVETFQDCGVAAFREPEGKVLKLSGELHGVLDPDPAPVRVRSAELEALLSTVLQEPGAWLATPSIQFGGRAPGELIGTDEEDKVVDLLHAVDLGLF